MAGRAPVATAALIMQAQPGAELACRGHNYKLPPGAAAQPRGVLSYYATAALTSVHSMADWLTWITAQSQQDVAAGYLPAFYRPALQLLGDPTHALPGVPG